MGNCILLSFSDTLRAMLIISIITAFALILPSTTTQFIGEKIWQNECSGISENLTHWGKGEEFASLGIGHFIWYSENKQDRFEETFPALLTFLESHGETLPSWLKNTKTCPWSTREEFYERFKSPQMFELREFLFKTKTLQALFITERLVKNFPQMIASITSPDKEKALIQFNKLIQTPQGLYALIDYLNFKGAGTSHLERYQGKGWGLLHVLLAMSPSGDAVEAFTSAAKKVLTERVELSPKERNEKKWLPGWMNRLDTYLDN
jgi:hypothetical protein